MIPWLPLLSSVTSIFFFFFYFFARIPFTACTGFSFPSFAATDLISLSGGSAISNGSLQLSDGRVVRNAGGAYYAQPIQLWRPTTNETTDFATYFEFVISFPGGSSNSSSGGGFAFFLAPGDSLDYQNLTGSLFSLSNDTTTNKRLLAVEFDSFRDQNSSSNGTAGNNDTLAAQVSYNATSKALFVSVKNLHVSSSNSSSLDLTQKVDMRQVLPEKVLVGFSVTNGSKVVVQKITKWNFSSTLEAEGGGTLEAEGGGGRRAFKKWMLIPIAALVLAAVVVATVSACYVWGGQGSILFAILTVVERIARLVSLPLVWCGFVKRMWEGEQDKNNGESLMDDEFSTGTGPRRFSYKELVTATSNFSEKRKLGEGGFGGVYKGFLNRSGKEVAVKKISSKSKQGKKEYASEVKIISRLRHRNLVQLIGWCHERGEFLLVYEFLPNGSLDYHLFNRKTTLPWGIRYNIALGLASALLYLHEEWEQCVVHRDVKSSNVMLDSGFNAKLGDFGLARLVDHQLGQHATGPAGTLGYLAPECFNTGKASKESDVYSFGIVALEIATGRRAVEHSKDEDEVRLVDWVWEMNGRGRLLHTADRSLDKDYDAKQIERLMLVGLWCAHPDHTQRPSMREVIQAFTFEGAIPDLPRTMPVPVFAVPPVQGSNSSTPTVTFGSLTTGR
ncbi:L-type lectin-domain containing receptor kinase IX.1-like [Musa acuminata AAA Group]|uniref:L-type lectin-domain containing receptor kinase IX.1-like n=1 Tax=Musa acuminata AAA Group TaxID=214697 RepID=UPI0031DD4B56